MKTITIAITYGLLFILFLGCSATDSQYLVKSEEVGNWLNDQKRKKGNESIWVDEVGKDKVSLSLSSGVSGKVLFYLELYLATKNDRYLDEVNYGCQFIVNHLPKSTHEAKSIRNSTSMYGDISGSAFILMETYKVTRNDQWKSSVNHCLSLLDSLSDQPDGRYWNKFNDILVGSSGTGLLLLYLHEELQNPLALQMAKEAALELDKRAVNSQDSLYWYLNQDNNINLPNFSHGAAGVGYFFTRLYETTKEPHYIDIAKKVANYLELIAWKPNNSFLLPYGFPDYDWERDYDIGWGHGPAGTARFFFKLWQVTKEDKWLETVKQCANGIKYSGLPNAPNEKFGENKFPLDMRFGLGSVVDFYINLKKENLLDEDDNYLESLLTTLDQRAIVNATQQRHWEIERYGFMKGTKGSPATFTGYFYGSAGLGLLYIKLHNMINETASGIKLPDDPF